MNIVTGRDWGKAICEKLGVDPNLVNHIRIDLGVDDVALIHVTMIGDQGVMGTTPDDLAGAGLVVNGLLVKGFKEYMEGT